MQRTRLVTPSNMTSAQAEPKLSGNKQKKVYFSPIMKMVFVLAACILSVFAFIIKNEGEGNAVHKNQPTVEERTGFWTKTANIDWCETNYHHSEYIAEFWNSFSSLAFVVVALIAWKRDVDLFNSKNPSVTVANSFHFKLRLAYVTLAVVGIGSVLFHATLSWHMQILDELPMIYCILSFCWILETLLDDHEEIVSDAENCNSSKDSKLKKFLLKGHRSYVPHILSFVAVLGTALELLFPTRPELFQFFFVGLVVYAIVQSVRLHQLFHDFSQIQYLLEVSMLFFCLGSSSWILEPFLCSQFGFLQLHTCWHIGIATGLGFYMKFCQDVVLKLNQARKQKEMKSLLPSLKETMIPLATNGSSSHYTRKPVYLAKE